MLKLWICPRSLEPHVKCGLVCIQSTTEYGGILIVADTVYSSTGGIVRKKVERMAKEGLILSKQSAPLP